MKNLFLFLSILLLFSCQSANDPFEYGSEAEWKLAFRVFESEMLENYELGSQQFDSLIVLSSRIQPGILNSGLKCLAQLNQNEKLFHILEKSSVENKSRICKEEWFQQLPAHKRKETICRNISLSKEEYTHPQLRQQLLIMYVNDQYVRGTSAEDLHQYTKIGVEENLYDDQDLSGTDYINREKLKEMVAEFGFPTKDMVGELGMTSVFLVIQHADMDKEYQKSQLENLKKAAKNGDVRQQQYAFLCDRVLVNAGKEQLYGSQFSNVDHLKGEATLSPVQDIENLNSRRREMGMMPIESYKRLMLSTGKKPIEEDHKRSRLESIQNGLQAPDGNLITVNDEVVSLHDFKGKLLAIDFWAMWCSPCLQETPKFLALAKKYKNENVKFITVSIDEPASSWKEYIQENNWKGNHYWLGNKKEDPLFSFIYSEMEVDSTKMILEVLPKYVFISAEGKILNNQAPFPSQTAFENELKQHLKLTEIASKN